MHFRGQLLFSESYIRIFFFFYILFRLNAWRDSYSFLSISDISLFYQFSMCGQVPTLYFLVPQCFSLKHITVPEWCRYVSQKGNLGQGSCLLFSCLLSLHPPVPRTRWSLLRGIGNQGSQWSNADPLRKLIRI